VMSGISKEAITASIKIVRSQYETELLPIRPADYVPDDVSWKVVKLIQSYVPYVLRKTWGIG